jgi:Tfp pilus assembly protein PilO
MTRLSKDSKMLIAIVALVLFAGYYFLIRPQAAAVAQARVDRAAVEQSVTDLQVLLERAGGESDGAETSAADVDALAAAIPPDDELADLLRQLDAIAGTSGMVHSSISPSPAGPNPLGPGGSIQIAITATGSHDGARAYLTQLVSMRRLVLIEQIGLHVQPGGAEAQLQLAIRVFTTAAPIVTL